METDDDRPELPVPAKEQHDGIALFDALSLEIVGSPRAHFLHILEREAAFILILVEMDHAQTIRLFLRDSIDNVERKVELICVLKSDFRRISVLPLLDRDEIRYKVRSLESVRGSFLFNYIYVFS